jgi:hypothetical protein
VRQPINAHLYEQIAAESRCPTNTLRYRHQQHHHQSSQGGSFPLPRREAFKTWYIDALDTVEAASRRSTSLNTLLDSLVDRHGDASSGDEFRLLQPMLNEMRSRCNVTGPRFGFAQSPRDSLGFRLSSRPTPLFTTKQFPHPFVYPPSKRAACSDWLQYFLSVGRGGEY